MGATMAMIIPCVTCTKLWVRIAEHGEVNMVNPLQLPLCNGETGFGRR